MSFASFQQNSAYSCNLRWRIVYQHLGMGLSCRDVAKSLNIDPSTVSRIVSRFDETGSQTENESLVNFLTMINSGKTWYVLTRITV